MNKIFTMKPDIFCLSILSVLCMGPSLYSMQPPPPPPTPEPLGAVPGFEPEATELTRGPIHEAFAQPFQMKSGGDFVVTEVPPEPIAEYPPHEMPESDAYQWVSGYWGWEPDEGRFIWISGVWRLAPEGMVWNPGYWVEIEGGYTWVSGSWVKEGEVYLIDQVPPEAREENPGQPPTAQHFWVPGHWVPNQGGFAWRAGFWTRGYEGRIWIPFRYLWTPQGYLVVDGYWDYDLSDRGVLYSPVAFDHTPPPTYRYSPTVITRVDYLPTHLFVHRNYGHYCFGDYYGFQRPGIFYPWTGRNFGFYDPLRLFFLTFHRDRFNRYRDRHDYYHRHARFRPRRTWRDQRNYYDRHRNDDNFRRGDFQDSFVGAGRDSLRRGDDVGVRVRMKDDRKRWDNVVQQNDRKRDFQKKHYEDLKKQGKFKKDDGRSSNRSKERISTVGPLNLKTKQSPSSNRLGRIGSSDQKQDDRSRSIRVAPGNSRSPAVRGQDSPDTGAIQKLREQNSKMQSDRSRRGSERGNDSLQGENQRRIESLNKLQEDARRRSPGPSSIQKQPVIKPSRRSSEPRREIKLPPQQSRQPVQQFRQPTQKSRQPQQQYRQPTQRSRQPQQSFKSPQRSSSSQSGKSNYSKKSNKSRGSSSSKGSSKRKKK